MSTESKEHLSTFMDGEVSRESARFLVRRLAADGSLRETWSRYHLIRDCLRQQDGDFVSHDLRERVRGALADEPVPAATARGRWLRSAAGTAIAASVALAAVLAVGPDRDPVARPALETAGPAASAAEPFVSPNIGSIVPRSQPVNLSGTEGEAERELNAYLLRHYQVTSGAGGRGFVSFVPVVVMQGVVQSAAESESAGETGESDSVRR